jgi:hypothetical protein
MTRGAYEAVLRDYIVDELLWGNHDRAVFDSHHIFGGFRPPIGPVKGYMMELQNQGRYTFAAQAHGFLLTHAGLHSDYDAFLPDDLEETVRVLNTPPGRTTEMKLSGAYTSHRMIRYGEWSMRVSPLRGAWSMEAGGILWRDLDEPVSDKFDQVFGHSAQRDGVTKHIRSAGRESFCIDIGGKSHARLAGIWLPERRVVRVDLN